MSRVERAQSISKEKERARKERLQNLGHHFEEMPRVGLKTTIYVLTSVFLLGWVALFVREAVLVL